MEKSEIIAKTGISRRHLNYILKRQRKPSLKKAIILEKATGVNRLAWLYPEENDNPYFPKGNNYTT